MSQSIPKTFWDERFDSKEYYYGKQPNDFLKAHAHYFPEGGHILSLGEGEGRNAVYLAKKHFNVTALDSAKTGLDKTKKLAKEKNVQVHLLLENLKNYAFEKDKWDGVLNIFCHLPAKIRKKIHENLPATLKKDGVFLMEAYTPEQINYGTGGPKNVELLYDPETIKDELKGLELIHFKVVEREIREGIGHTGLSSVLQVIAKKK